MSTKNAKRIYEKHNPADGVKRCPNGRAPVRKELDTYARAAVNLYGVISKDDFVEIFNGQNTEQTTADEVFMLLLPLVLKKKWYCFYKGYIVHYWAMDDFDYADTWIEMQEGKPRFIPEKEAFLRFENQYYESETQKLAWGKLFEFICAAWPDNDQNYRFYSELKDISKFDVNIRAVGGLLEQNQMIFQDGEQMQAFFDLLMAAHNNTRLWSNKGYSPNEMIQIMQSKRPKRATPEIIMQERRKIGANEPCPCGSGRKYKRCCRLIDEAQTAQLSRSECTLFYETWYGLMGFINERAHIIRHQIKPIYPNPVGDDMILKVSEALWKDPKWIDTYLNDVTLPEAKISLLSAWRDFHLKGTFFLLAYQPEYAIVIGPDEQGKDRLYGVKGISRSLADAMQRKLPLQFETVLLPFKDKIIYDGFMRVAPIDFGEGTKRAFREMYDKALERGIITRFGEDP